MKIKLLPRTEHPADLGQLDEIWAAWILERGQLFDPLSGSTIGWQPGEIRAIPIRLAQIAALQRQIRELSRGHVHRATFGDRRRTPDRRRTIDQVVPDQLASTGQLASRLRLKS